MVRRCGNCGAPAPDSNSRFCDLCGAPFKEEQATPQGLPVCPSCGAVVSDLKAQFCDACGAPLAKPVCPVCGNTAPSTHSKFCTRCGATFVPGSAQKNRAPARQPASPLSAEQEAVVVKLKKGRLPVPEEPPEPAEEWDPWTDGDPAYDISAPLPRQPQKPSTDLQRVADEMARSQVQRAPAPQPEMMQLTEPKRKYSHLPLIADELKADLDRRATGTEPQESDGRAPAKRGKKKGLFG